MTFQELLGMLEMDDPSEFEYFEDLSLLTECGNEIATDVLEKLFEGADMGTVSELIGSYFDDVLEAVPDSETDMYMLLENISRWLKGLANAADGEEGIRRFCEAYSRFRNWFAFTSEAELRSRDTGDIEDVALLEALTASRLEKLGESEFEYDFSRCLDFDLDEYAVDLIDLTEQDSEDIMSEGFVPDEYEDGDLLQ